MKTKYIDLINQTYEFPQEEFTLDKDQLLFSGINLMELVRHYGTPLKFTYLPKISENIQSANKWFNNAIKEHEYKGIYHYCYCTKSSHFSHVLHKALENNVHIETSSAYDIDIVSALWRSGALDQNRYVLCNGFKPKQYIDNITGLIKAGFSKCIPILDNARELEQLGAEIQQNFHVGIRIASEEEPKFEFYTSRLGIGYKNIVPFYENHIANHPHAQLKMLHFFINTGIRDTAYYWNELHKCLKVYVQLKKICPSLDSLNIGGGFPIKSSLAFEYDYAYMASEIINQIKLACQEAGVEEPHVFTEFGSYTVGESGGSLFQVLDQKQQNDREKWNMIDSSFITTMPDTWAINKRFIMLPLNRWYDAYERVLLGGLTCDSDDYYNSEQNVNAIFLPKFKEEAPLYIGFFNTGAYQESVGGFAGLQHCLIPNPKHIVLDRDAAGVLTHTLFSEQQNADQFLQILGYSPSTQKQTKDDICRNPQGVQLVR